jgi:hypothetical protein
VTKLTDGSNEQTGDEHVSSERERDFSIRTGENTNVKRISSTRSLREISEPVDQEAGFTAENQSVSSAGSTEIFAFDVYEREGFDQIMRTVAGGADQEQEAFARSICDYLEIFESLASGRYVYPASVLREIVHTFNLHVFATTARRLAIWYVVNRV